LVKIAITRVSAASSRRLTYRVLGVPNLTERGHAHRGEPAVPQRLHQRGDRGGGRARRVVDEHDGRHERDGHQYAHAEERAAPADAAERAFAAAWVAERS
jgi:hypothetical protein